MIDREDAPRIHQFRAGDGELADRTAAEDHHGIARRNLRNIRAEIPGWENIRYQDGLIVADFVRKLHQPNVRERDSRIFRLQSIERPRLLRAAVKRATCLRPVRIGIIALGIVASPAIRTIATPDCGRDHDPIAGFEVSYVLSNLFDKADTLVAKDRA